jgi:hypothetical protein
MGQVSVMPHLIETILRHSGLEFIHATPIKVELHRRWHQIYTSKRYKGSAKYGSQKYEFMQRKDRIRALKN